MIPELTDDLLTVAEAAKLLKVSGVTVKRYLKQGRLRGYHLGPRAVRLRRADVMRLLTPAFGEEVTVLKEGAPPHVDWGIVPLVESDVKRGLAALAASERLVEQMLARRQGRPLPSSWEDLRRARQERSERL